MELHGVEEQQHLLEPVLPCRWRGWLLCVTLREPSHPTYPRRQEAAAAGGGAGPAGAARGAFAAALLAAAPVAAPSRRD